MIRNDNQLRQAILRREELEQEHDEVRRSYSGIEAEIMTAGLELELKQINEDVREFSLLRLMKLDDAVMGPLKRPILLDQIGDLLTKIRLASGLTQDELARKMGWKQSNVSRFESENYGSHSVSKVVEYASVLGVWLHVVPALTDEPAAIEFSSSEEIRFSQFLSTAILKQGEIDKPIEFDSNTHSGNRTDVFQGNEAFS